MELKLRFEALELELEFILDKRCQEDYFIFFFMTVAMLLGE